VDASYAVHPDMKSHTGATMSLGSECLYSMSSKQRLISRSSTESELIAVNDAMSKILWTRLFLQAQGYNMAETIIYQDNQSTMLLENNGKLSTGKKTKHIEIRFFFITDNIKKKHVRVEYCPTDKMVADFFTKPLQGSKFIRFKQTIMGMDQIPPCTSTGPVRKECVEYYGAEKGYDKSGKVTSRNEVETDENHSKYENN
jgi:hypothetical protein